MLYSKKNLRIFEYSNEALFRRRRIFEYSNCPLFQSVEYSNIRMKGFLKVSNIRIFEWRGFSKCRIFELFEYSIKIGIIRIFEYYSNNYSNILAILGLGFELIGWVRQHVCVSIERCLDNRILDGGWAPNQHCPSPNLHPGIVCKCSRPLIEHLTTAAFT